MNLLHVGTLSPHVHRAMRMFTRYGPREWRQEHVQVGEQPLARPDLVLVHAVNQFHEAARSWGTNGVPTVGWMWNTDWTTARDAARTMTGMAACELLLGDEEARWAVGDLAGRYVGHRPLVDAEVFRPDPLMVRTGVFVARGWQGHPLYWAEEARQALEGLPGVLAASGYFSPRGMAVAYRRARAVVALREDCGPSYTVVEAVLCGAVPVVSMCPQIHKHFEDGGAALCDRHPQSIRRAVEGVLGMTDEQYAALVARNQEHFGGWTEQAQGPGLVERVLEVARVRA